MSEQDPDRLTRPGDQSGGFGWFAYAPPGRVSGWRSTACRASVRAGAAPSRPWSPGRTAPCSCARTSTPARSGTTRDTSVTTSTSCTAGSASRASSSTTRWRGTTSSRHCAQNDASGGPAPPRRRPGAMTSSSQICVHRARPVDNLRYSLGAGFQTAAIHSEGCRDGAVFHTIGKFSSRRSTGPQVYGLGVPPSIQTLRRPTSASIRALVL